MKVVKLDDANKILQEKIINLSQLRQDALNVYNVRDYTTLSHLVDALYSVKDLLNSLPSIEIKE